MVITPNREAVIENIRLATESSSFNTCVELEDPELSEEKSKELISAYIDGLNSPSYKVKRFFARCFANVYGLMMQGSVRIVGIEKLKNLNTGAIVTSNHFNPDDSVPVRSMAKKLGKKHLKVVVRDSNLAMDGLVGFLMNYADTVPVSSDIRYLHKTFTSMLFDLINNKELVLIYPEQEMWFNYKKPRPLKNGAYYYASKLNVPIISCFVELREHGKKDERGFYRVEYILHVLGLITPDPKLSQRENCDKMMQEDYELKRNAYEKAYSKKLDYTFNSDDIAGKERSQ